MIGDQIGNATGVLNIDVLVRGLLLSDHGGPCTFISRRCGLTMALCTVMNDVDICTLRCKFDGVVYIPTANEGHSRPMKRQLFNTNIREVGHSQRPKPNGTVKVNKCRNL